MKKLTIIRKSQLDEVIEALHEIGIDFMTYWKVTGVGNELASSIYRSTRFYETRLIERTHISFVCCEIYVDSSCQAIINAARTGEMGDGKIFISPCGGAGIRTGETGPEIIVISKNNKNEPHYGYNHNNICTQHFLGIVCCSTGLLHADRLAPRGGGLLP